MTGVMWRAGLRLYDYQIGAHGVLTGITHRLRRAVTDGARVVNMSLGAFYDHPPGTEPGDSTRARRWGDELTTYLKLLATPSTGLPLIVLSAGNDTTSAFYDGFPLAGEDPEVGDHVIVVAASNDQGRLWDGSNSGPLVDKAAPGENVHTRVRLGA